METANKKVFLEAKNALRLKWPVQQSISYGVRICFEEETEENEIKYQVRITRLKSTDGAPALFQIDRTGDVFINETLPDLVADRLAYTAGKVFYPLVISVDKNGSFESVHNHQEILKRWETVKAKIRGDFEGSLVENYIARMEKQLAERERIRTALLQNDWFLQTFFKPIYKEYGPGYVCQSSYQFPVLKHLVSSGYATKESLNPQLNDFGTVELVHKGELMPVADDLIEVVRATGSYQGHYILHPNFRHIISVVSDFTYQEREKTNIKVKIFMIPENGQAFDHDFMPGMSGASSIQQSGLVVLDGPPKMGFWERLLNR